MGSGFLVKDLIGIFRECSEDILFFRNIRELDNLADDMISIMCRATHSVENWIGVGEIICEIQKDKSFCSFINAPASGEQMEGFLNRLGFVIDSFFDIFIRENICCDRILDYYNGNLDYFLQNYIHFLFCKTQNEIEKDALYNCNLDIAVQAERFSSPYIVFDGILVPYTLENYKKISKLYSKS